MSRLAVALILAAFASTTPTVARADEPPPPEEPVAPPLPVPSEIMPDTPGAPPAPAPTEPAGEPPAPAAPPPVAAPPREARFGDADEIVLSGDLSASLGREGESAAGGFSSSSISIAPAFDDFVAPDVSLGASAFVTYAKTSISGSEDVSSLSYGVTGRVGFNFWVGDRVSFWPKISLALSQVRTSISNLAELPAGYGTQVAASTQVGNVVSGQIYAPFLLHLAPHFFVGFGPQLWADFYNSTLIPNSRRTFLGAVSTVGGWF